MARDRIYEQSALSVLKVSPIHARQETLLDTEASGIFGSNCAILYLMTDQQTLPGAAEDAQKNRDIAAVGYIWILSVVVYFSRKDSPFVRFHAKQGMVLFALSIIVWVIPIVGRFLELIVLALAVLGFLGAAQGQWKEVPLIGPLARGDSAGVRSSWRHLLDGFLRGWREATKDMAKQAPKSPAPKPPVAPTPPSPVRSDGASPTPPSPKQ